MAVTAGLLSQVSVTATTASLVSAEATAGTGPYTYQWYRSTTSGFTPGAGSLIAGATALTLNDTGLVPNTQYYYAVIATDTGDSNATSTSAQLAVATSVPAQSQNAFSQSPYLGMIDMRFPYNTVSVLVDASQVGAVFAGSAVKMVDSAGGVPKVVACDAQADNVLGFINYSIKDIDYTAGSPAEISMSGNVMFLYATEAIARGAEVVLDIATKGGVKDSVGETGATIVGWAYDKAVAPGDLIRVWLSTPSFRVV